MDKQLADKMTEVLTFVQSGMQSAVELGKQELPVFIKEYLSYHLYASVLDLGFHLTLLVLFIYGFYSIKKYITNQGDDGFLHSLNYCTSGFLILFALGYSVNTIQTIIKIQLAPRVFLVDSLNHRLHGKD